MHGNTDIRICHERSKCTTLLGYTFLVSFYRTYTAEHSRAQPSKGNVAEAASFLGSFSLPVLKQWRLKYLKRLFSVCELLAGFWRTTQVLVDYYLETFYFWFMFLSAYWAFSESRRKSLNICDLQDVSGYFEHSGESTLEGLACWLRAVSVSKPSTNRPSCWSVL